MRLYRLGTAKHPVWAGAGAKMHGARWNPAGMAVIYASATQSLAMLERLVQRQNLEHTLPVIAEVPAELEIEDLMPDPPPNWRALGSPDAAAAGGAWLASKRTPLLRVPSAIVPSEANYLVNPAHPDAGLIRAGRPELLEWDARFFGIGAPG